MKAVFVLLAVTVAVYANPKHTDTDEELLNFDSLKNDIRSVEGRTRTAMDCERAIMCCVTLQSRPRFSARKAADTEENDDVDDLLGSLHVHNHKPLVQIEAKLRELKKIKASKGYKAKQNSPCAFAGWKRVRHVPASYGKWHPSTDQLKGTSVYGSEGDDSQPWSVHFAYDNFEEFGFATGDCEHWLVAKKSQVFRTNWRDSFDIKIEKSSWEHKQYGAKWFNRPGVHQDPYVSIRGYGVDSGRTHMYIGNNNNGGSNEFFMPREHDGADVYIR